MAWSCLAARKYQVSSQSKWIEQKELVFISFISSLLLQTQKKGSTFSYPDHNKKNFVITPDFTSPTIFWRVLVSTRVKFLNIPNSVVQPPVRKRVETLSVTTVNKTTRNPSTNETEVTKEQRHISKCPWNHHRTSVSDAGRPPKPRRIKVGDTTTNGMC